MIFICAANGGRGTARAVFRVKETFGETVRGEENMLSWPPLITRCSSPHRGNEQLASTELAGSTPTPSAPPHFTLHTYPPVCCPAFRCWFSSPPLTGTDFSGFSEYFDDIIGCKVWNLPDTSETHQGMTSNQAQERTSLKRERRRMSGNGKTGNNE